LRKMEVISERMQRDREGLRWGYIVAPHDALCLLKGEFCTFTGACTPGTVGKWVRRAVNHGGDDEPDWSLYPRFWAPRNWVGLDLDLIASVPKQLARLEPGLSQAQRKGTHEVTHKGTHKGTHD